MHKHIYIWNLYKKIRSGMYFFLFFFHFIFPCNAYIHTYIRWMCTWFVVYLHYSFYLHCCPDSIVSFESSKNFSLKSKNDNWNAHLNNIYGQLKRIDQTSMRSFALIVVNWFIDIEEYLWLFNLVLFYFSSIHHFISIYFLVACLLKSSSIS